jgi:NADH-quinone oxidoreductase subunit J
MADWIVFWVFGPISVASAVLMLFQRNAVHAALLLIVNFFTLAVFFLVLGSPFLFAVQIIVYAGAIMVLFLFVIMLLGVDREESLVERMKAQRPLAILLGLGLIAEVVSAVRLGVGLSRGAIPDFDPVNRGGNVRALARLLFSDYFFPFEVTSILLIVAAIGAVVMARRRPGRVRTQGQERLRAVGEMTAEGERVP